MRIYHFTLIFAVLAVMMLSMTAFSLCESFEEEQWMSNMDLVIDKASESAANVLKEAYSSGVAGVRDLAVDAFYASLSAGLGLADGTPALTLLRMYVPFIAVTDGDILWVCYDDYETADDGTVRLLRKWSDPIVSDSDGLEKSLEYYCNKHNEIAQRAGVVYRFSIPDTEGGLYLRSGEGVGFFVLFQGYPSERSGGRVYTGFSFAGTGIDDADMFFINLYGEGYASERFFHRKGCIYLSEL